MASLGDLTPDDFETHKGGSFRLTTATGELELSLVEVKRLGEALRKGGAFSLLFVSPPGPFLSQAIYTLTHPKVGTLELFLVPIGPTHGGNGYEAVFT
jgi:uncharacterized protein DUF6916